MKTIVRRMLDKSDTLMDEADESNDATGFGKAFLSGAIEGLAEGFFIAGAINAIFNVVHFVDSLSTERRV